MMASDGVLQVNGVDYQDVLWGLSSLKSSRQGHFFQRRFNKMMSGWGVSQSLPRDDISAVILTSGQEE